MSLFAPKNFAQGGGLLNDADVVIKEASISMFDYGGKRPDAVPAVRFLLGLEDGSEMEQYWSCGAASDWMPSEDGKKLVAIGKKTQLNSSSNAAILLASIVNAGFPEAKIEASGDDVSVFQDMEGHVMRVPAPKRGGLVKTPNADGTTREDTILTFASITKLPWEKKGGKASVPKATGAKTAPTPTPEPEENEGEDVSVEDRTQQVLLEILAATPAGLKKQELPGAIFKAVGAGDPQRTAMVQIAFKDEFLKSGPWAYDKGKISL
jgi:hypothetical protein